MLCEVCAKKWECSREENNHGLWSPAAYILVASDTHNSKKDAVSYDNVEGL